jgi:hypothetical protein
MTRFISRSDLFTIYRGSSYNNHGEPEVTIELSPGVELMILQEKARLMYNWFEEQQRELILREQNPALNDAWNQYQTLKTLVTPTKDLNGT